ncbi:MAG: hypothetical protein RL728_1203 [Bacteroidota bacterium]|jgi:hypothetical protein
MVGCRKTQFRIWKIKKLLVNLHYIKPKTKEVPMALFKELKELKEKLKYYEDMVPVNNMGKWGRSVAIESYKNKIANLESKIKKLSEVKKENNEK